MRFSNYEKRLWGLRKAINKEKNTDQFKRYIELCSKIIKQEELTETEQAEFLDATQKKQTPAIKYLAELFQSFNKPKTI